MRFESIKPPDRADRAGGDNTPAANVGPAFSDTATWYRATAGL